MTAIIRRTPNGYDVDISDGAGFSETIEGLYDLDTAFDYVRMHISYHDSKYV